MVTCKAMPAFFLWDKELKLLGGWVVDVRPSHDLLTKHALWVSVFKVSGHTPFTFSVSREELKLEAKKHN